MKQFLIFIFFGSILILASCRKDFSTLPSNGKLEFSKDTVFLDTVFTNIGSSTYVLKVYNRSKEAITIPKIQLRDGEDSGYRLNVDGLPGKYFENIDILAEDSIYVFIETTIDYNNVTNPIYEDQILFDTGGNQQDVKLVTLVEDAHFLYPNKENGIIETLTINGQNTNIMGRYLLDEELTFTDDKPYVIYGFMMVGSVTNQPKILNIETGTNIHFHRNSGLFVGENSSLHINGSRNLDEENPTEVVLQGDRLEPVFENEPDQWFGIYLLSGSTNNQVNYATIKNANYGIIVEGMQDLNTPVLSVSNSKFFNHSQYGIIGIYSNIEGENLVFNNIGFSAFAGFSGGAYDFTHCTFANFWGADRTEPNIYLNNYYITRNDDGEIISTTPIPLHFANFTNCIITGDEEMEIEMDKMDGEDFNYFFKNNLIQFNDIQNIYEGNPLYNFNDSSYFLNNIFNGTADFKNTSSNELMIGEASDANGQAAASGTSQVPEDILGVSRANPADIGAYEHRIFED